MPKKQVILQPGKDKPIRNRHHWIFSGAIAQMPKFEEGEILPVYDSENELIGHAYFNSLTAIRGRMINFDDSDPLESLAQNIDNAINFRKQLFDENTNTFRVINGEGDAIPGLIVDKYNDDLVIQISTVGIEKLKPQILQMLVDKLRPQLIYEKSAMHSRKEEGLPMFEGVVYGEMQDQTFVVENGIKFQVELAKAQKTGLYLDQREMRKLVGELAGGRRLLNCFAYTGGFSLYAARGGATLVDSVDIAADAMRLAKRNFELNGFDAENNHFYAADVFKFLREDSLDYDFVILDPPAFAKKRSDVPKACGGYRDINRIALQKMPAQSYLLTCSCSYFVDEATFQRVIFQAATDSGRNVKIVQKHHLAPDHPINIYHPEGDYLKSLLLYID